MFCIMSMTTGLYYILCLYVFPLLMFLCVSVCVSSWGAENIIRFTFLAY